MPPLARQARIQGVVVLDLTVGSEGIVDNIRVISGHPLLIQAAIDAVKQWQYAPQPEAASTTATFNFALDTGRSESSPRPQ
jgi:protein TonB